MSDIKKGFLSLNFPFNMSNLFCSYGVNNIAYNANIYEIIRIIKFFTPLIINILLFAFLNCYVANTTFPLSFLNAYKRLYCFKQQTKKCRFLNPHSYYLFAPLVKSKFNYAAALINGSPAAFACRILCQRHYANFVPAARLLISPCKIPISLCKMVISACN